MNMESLRSSEINNGHMILTSAGPTTQDITDVMRESIHDRIGNRCPRILQIQDQWNSFAFGADVSLADRFVHRAESVGSRTWSRMWQQFVFGKSVHVERIELSSSSTEDVEAAIERNDIFLAPGGNTFLQSQGLLAHKDVIKSKIHTNEVLYIGESAGSIVAGASLFPAHIEPADIKPSPGSYDALGLIDADIIIHAEGNNKKSVVPFLGAIATRALNMSNSNLVSINQYIHANRNVRKSIVLNDGQALIVDGTNRTLIV